MAVYVALRSHNQWQSYKSSMGWTWLNSQPWEGGQFYSLETCTMLYLGKDEAGFDQLFMYISKHRKHGSWKSWGDQDDWMRDKGKLQRLKFTTMCQFWKGSSQGHLRSISLTPVWIKTMEKFTYSSTDRNTQLMLVKLAVRAGCLVLLSNRSEQPNPMSLFFRVMNQRKPTPV